MELETAGSMTSSKLADFPSFPQKMYLSLKEPPGAELPPPRQPSRALTLQESYGQSSLSLQAHIQDSRSLLQLWVTLTEDSVFSQSPEEARMVNLLILILLRASLSPHSVLHTGDPGTGKS